MKQAIITVFLLFTFIILYASDPVFSRKKDMEDTTSSDLSSNSKMENQLIYPVWGYFIDASVGFSDITNNNLSSELWNSNGDLAYTFTAGYFRSFGSNFKIKTGFGVSNYRNSSTGNGEIISPEFKDIDNDTYTESLALINSKQSSNLMYLSVPFILEFGNTNINKLGLYVDVGMNYSYLIYENNTVEGTYTTKGNYNQWGVTLEDIPELGFYTSKEIDSNTGFKKFNYSVLGGAGITIPISGVTIFKLGLVACLGLNDIGNNKSDNSDNSSLSEEANNFRSKYINNTLAVTKGSKTHYIGIELGLYINKLVK